MPSTRRTFLTTASTTALAAAAPATTDRDYWTVSLICKNCHNSKGPKSAVKKCGPRYPAWPC